MGPGTINLRQINRFDGQPVVSGESCADGILAISLIRRQHQIHQGGVTDQQLWLMPGPKVERLHCCDQQRQQFHFCLHTPDAEQLNTALEVFLDAHAAFIG